MCKLRVGHRMKEILNVLKETTSRTPITLTEIIMNIRGLKQIQQGYENEHQLELVSALAGDSISWPYARSRKVQEAYAEANRLYALYSRSLRLLHENGLVHTNDRAEGRGWSANRCNWFIAKSGREYIQLEGVIQLNVAHINEYTRACVTS